MGSGEQGEIRFEILHVFGWAGDFSELYYFLVLRVGD